MALWREFRRSKFDPIRSPQPRAFWGQNIHHVTLLHLRSTHDSMGESPNPACF
ncbi:hypothetical protein SCLCIDRAFT_1214518 [Scleroderma citrinum Foug A]|uniref:Uncharacterized protein n=1 Tax=Scleroderma citrinum Foug A TaxID=1036808 RepID=A0A0C3E3D5_9AGAM|nr:hypothetical protein SCLCIDRAFT_1214518 [Scleroderma citrinum Foug A]